MTGSINYKGSSTVAGNEDQATIWLSGELKLKEVHYFSAALPATVLDRAESASNTALSILLSNL